MQEPVLLFIGIAGKIISVILLGLLIAIGLWIICSFLVKKLYPVYSLKIRHHLFGLLIAVITFILYCSLFATSAVRSGIDFSKDLLIYATSLVEALDKQEDLFRLTNMGDDRIKEEITRQFNELVLHKESNIKKYSGSLGMSDALAKDITSVLLLSATKNEKAEIIADAIYRHYLAGIEKSVNKTWWRIFLGLLFVQIFYFTMMLYRAGRWNRKSAFFISYDSGDSGLYD